jgi:ribosomal protein S27E
MPFVMFGSKGKARRVPDGQFEKRRCPECGKTTVFRECVVERTFTAYHFIDLWSSKSTKFCCDACGAVMALDETLAPELSEREQAQLEALEAKQAAIAAKQAEVERLRAQREAEGRKQTRAQAVEDELAAMKARLGLSGKK